MESKRHPPPGARLPILKFKFSSFRSRGSTEGHFGIFISFSVDNFLERLKESRRKGPKYATDLNV